MTMRSRLIVVLATLILLGAYAPAAQAGSRTTTVYGFPDDPGIPSVAE